MSLWGIGLFLFTCSAHAFFSPGIPFYRSPDSPFPSGQTRQEELEKNKRSELTQNFYQVRKDGHSIRLGADQVLRDLDLSMIAVDIATGETGHITQARPPWYEWESDANTNKRARIRTWKSSEQLAPVPDDLGVAYVISDHGFRQTPDRTSEALFTAHAGDRFKVLGFKNESVYVESLSQESLRGFLQLPRVILKVDTAAFVMQDKGKWQAFAFREGSRACLNVRKCIPLSEIKGLLTTPERGLIGREIANLGMVPRSVVELRRTEWVRWAQSEIKGHGRVFWKKQEHLELAGPSTDVISTEQILTRQLTSVAVRPGRPEEALVASQGIFWTTDGKIWTKLTQFQGEDLPVAINNRGEWFVGGFYSRDQGKTFHPFLKWEDLTTLVESQHRRVPGVLRLSDIRAPGAGKVEVHLDTGAGKMRLVGSNRYGLVTDWKILEATN